MADFVCSAGFKCIPQYFTEHLRVFPVTTGCGETFLPLLILRYQLSIQHIQLLKGDTLLHFRYREYSRDLALPSTLGLSFTTILSEEYLLVT